MGEFDKYSVEELADMVSVDDPDAMDDLATGWANAAKMLEAESEALKKHLKTIRRKWTSGSSAPYMRRFTETIAHIDGAQQTASRRAESLGEMAAWVREAKHTVTKAHDDWRQAKSGHFHNYLKEVEKYGQNPSAYLFMAGAPPKEPDAVQTKILREPFDASARKDMEAALGHYTTQEPNYIDPMPKYKPVQAPKDQWILPSREKGWGHKGDGGSNAADTAGLAATSYGGNATGGHGPALQNGPAPSPVTPPSAPAPTPTVGPNLGPVPGGLPVGGVPPLGKAPMPPALKPTVGEGPVTGRTGPTARTPNLPSRSVRTVRGGMPEEIEPGVNRAGRGLVKSQMEPQDRTGQPRRANEVLGRRGTAKPRTTAEVAEGAPPRRTMRPVIRGAKSASAGRSIRYAESEPVDYSAKGYSRGQILGAKNRVGGFTRDPLVARKLDPGQGVRTFGKREEPVSEARQIIQERRARLAKRRAAADGLSRPVIRNGIVHVGQLDTVDTAAEDSTPDALWTLPATAPAIVGQRRPMPEFDHDPGPGVITGNGTAAAEETPGAHSPGPIAFGERRARPDTTNWPQ